MKKFMFLFCVFALTIVIVVGVVQIKTAQAGHDCTYNYCVWTSYFETGNFCSHLLACNCPSLNITVNCEEMCDGGYCPF